MGSTTNPVFSHRVTVRGQLHSNFVFQSKSEVDKWLITEFPNLEIKYGKLEFAISDLPMFKVGDICRVIGEGCDEFVIRDLVKYSDHRYGFILDSGWAEEVAKCY